MSPARTQITVEVEGRTLSLSNLEKVLFPAAGFTKGQVIDYYTRIAPVLLPHLKRRPLTLKRYPDGVDGPFFFEKKCPQHRPPWVRTASVRSGSGSDTDICFCVCEDLPTLVWLANLADLEMHVPMGTVTHPERPTALVFDLDPGPPADIATCSHVALLVRDVLAEDGLQAWAKSSGSKGMQLYVPINSRTASYDVTTPYAHALAQRLEKEHPDLVVSRQLKTLRPGKVLVDWHQNTESKTTVCVYSLRARPQPTVSTPLTWEEVEQCASSGDAASLSFVTDEVLARVESLGDLFAPVLTEKQRLPRVTAARGG